MSATVTPKIPTSPTEPKPTLSIFNAVIIITGIVVGGGIFAFPPLVASIAGSVEWMYIAWLLGAALTLIGALCYAELATTYPDTGGDYHFLMRAYGKDISFFYGWSRMIVIIPGSITLLAFVLGDYMSRVIQLGENSSAIYAAVTVVALTAVNITGLRESTRTQTVLTLLLAAGFISVILASLIEPAATTPAPSAFEPGIPATLGTALLFVLFTFGGWNEAAYVSAEVKGGKRAILRALLFAIATITVIYLIFIWALVHGLGFEDLKTSKAVAAEIAERAFGAPGEKIVGAFVALAALTSINATMIIGARANYSIASDWSITGFMSRWDNTRNAPVTAFLVQGTIALALVLFAAIEQNGIRTMVEFTAPVFWFFFMLTGIALFILRIKHPHRPRPYAVPLYPVLPLIFVGTSAYLFYSSVMYAQSQQAVHIALYVMATGLLAWIVIRLSDARRRVNISQNSTDTSA